MDLSSYNSQLQDLGVDLIIQFGSQVEGVARHDSDQDAGVLFNPQAKYSARRYGQLYALLQEIFSGKRLDLVELVDAPPAMQFRAATKGVPLYQATQTSFVDFREYAMQRFFDFQPIIRIHEEALRI